MWAVFHKRKLSSSQIILFGFAFVILIGALVLMLPISSKTGLATPFLDCLFTSTSAVCVTGLIVYDTATHWTVFGQTVIIILIQIGGMGVVTVAAAITMASGKKISLMQRSTMQDAVSAHHVGGIVKFTGFILKGIFLMELVGAVVMAPVFISDYGLIKGIWMAVFHSISAFCNAGFDILGEGAPFSSLTSYAANPVINIAITGLIVIGGLGFLTWQDVRQNGYHIQRYRMQSKVILAATGALLLIPALYFFFFEFADLPFAERFWGSWFQSVTPRTAGFNTLDLTQMSETGQTVISLLMLIGGSPGSTAGGMKTTTFAVLIACAVAVFRKRENGRFFGRRIADDTVKNAITVFLLYITLFFAGGMIISKVESLPLVTCLFESASAVGTVGLTLGITPGLGLVSKLILIAQMFIGRVGGLTLIFATLPATKNTLSKLPLEKITVG
ncbi:MAG: Trk family potassium uptake protein [Oscillospiraceae bacterium]|nr:Trk family potassium uptake protein [Oscillospiraceae bacterium]